MATGLAVAESFSDLTRVENQSEFSTPSTDYDRTYEDSILDEEVVHWRKFAARIFCCLLLLIIIICCALEVISPRFLILAGLVCGLLILLLLATYIDILAFIRAPCKKKTNQHSIDSERPSAQEVPVMHVGSPMHRK